MKQLLIVSTGRCGTKRIFEMLSTALAETDIVVRHQYQFSRVSNLAGHLMYYTGSINWLNKLLFRRQSETAGRDLIMTDPLSSMIIPDQALYSKDNYFLHIERDPTSFARSMFTLSRKRPASLIAHNFIPLWMPGLWPLQNLLGIQIISTYESVCNRKNAWFQEHYGSLKNYRRVTMEECFEQGFLEQLVNNIFNTSIELPKQQLEIKSNQSGT